VFLTKFSFDEKYYLNGHRVVARELCTTGHDSNWLKNEFGALLYWLLNTFEHSTTGRGPTLAMALNAYASS